MPPEYHTHEDFVVRSEKRDQLLARGIDPYPATFPVTHQISQILAGYGEDSLGNSDDAAAGNTPEVTVAGRLVLFRPMGKNAFAHIQGEHGRLQLMANRDATQVTGYTPAEGEPNHIKFFEKYFDLGDIVGVRGHLFRTNRGELTLFIKQATLLCKTLLPLPDKHGGLVDKEMRYRKRWLDLIAHEDVGHTFRTRSRILHLIRTHLVDHDFMEVETPVLQNLYGGAAAKPFTTELHSHDQEMFMRISLEIALKKLIVGGTNRVFEMGRVFRNEGVDRNHNPEFTLLEAYAAYWDYFDLMKFMEELCEKIALEVTGSTQVTYQLGDEELTLDFKAPWKRMTMKGALQEMAGIDVDALSDDELRAQLKEKTDLEPLQYSKSPRGLLISFLFEELVEEKLIQPCHITDHPIETTPLCKPHRDPKAREAGLVERFESYALGHEICNAYSELNDPVIQRQLLEDQQQRRDEGDEEASPLDEEFIESICQGMPPCAGIGIGIDRLIMLFTGSHSIRDVIYFPLMRRE
jgi:lysyl-tRNA synthetase, class II